MASQLRIPNNAPPRTYDLGPLGKRRLRPGAVVSVADDVLEAVGKAIGGYPGLTLRAVALVIRKVEEAVEKPARRKRSRKGGAPPSDEG